VSGQARIELEVPSAAAGTRLDQFLAKPLGSRARAQSLIDAERVTVDGRVRPKRHAVRPGERIEVCERAAITEPPASGVPFTVRFEDEHMLIVDKPAGVVVHPARGHRTGTLAQALGGRAAGGDEPWRAGIVHRLDRDTSGCCWPRADCDASTWRWCRGGRTLARERSRHRSAATAATAC